MDYLTVSHGAMQGEQVKVQMDPDMDSDDVFTKIDEQIDLRRQISLVVPDLEYLEGVNAYRAYFRSGRQKLLDVAVQLKADLTRENALRVYGDVRFIQFSLLSVHLSFENFLYEGAKSIRGSESVCEMIDRWKKLPEVRLMKLVRNRVQHGAMPLGSLRVEVRTRFHREGEAFAAAFDPGEYMWERAIAEANVETRNFYEGKVKTQPDKLEFLLQVYEAALERLCAQVEASFRQSYRREFDAKSELLAKLDEVDRWLAAQGVVDPW